WEEMRDLAASGKVVGLGEFGLDFHYDNSPREAQREAFRRGIALAAETRLPLIIHSREAPEETLAILDAACPGGNYPAGVFHCFTGTPDFAQEVMKRGFFIGFTGIVTFPNADDVRETAREVPLERMLVETDAPFCSPVPMRGKTNEPAYVVHVARKIAELHGATEGDVRRITTQNAVGLFRLPLADALGAKLEKGAKRGH
ncbi:MAG: TatD family hydrolase, partial [Planctomycetia bacterium]|nr:TatD family hydrolase [Planctomycetia bacterium]